MTKFKTLVNDKGEYMDITDNSNGRSGGRYRICKVSVPSLMGMKVTTESIIECYNGYIASNKLEGLEIITVNLDKI